MYENPITKICQDIRTQMVQRDEQMILEAIQKQDIFIDKEELIKALNYDRNQYSKGYKDGVSEVLDRIRDKISEQSRMHMDGDLYIKVSECMQIIDKYKAENEDKE